MRNTAFVSSLATLFLTATMLLSHPSAAAAFPPQTGPTAAKVVIYPAPAGQPLSGAYKVQVGGRDVPVYLQRVSPQDKTLRLSSVDDKSQYGLKYEEAGFAYFDADGPVDVTVTFSGPVTAARLLPTSPAIPVSIQGNTMRFTANSPQNLTLEVNHLLVRTLHIFMNPIETGAPSPKDANVVYLAPGNHALSAYKMPPDKSILYFGPGIHNIDNLALSDGQMVYIAGGAVVRSTIRADEPFVTDTLAGQTSKVYTKPAIAIYGTRIKIRGRGILDGLEAPGKRLLSIQGQDIGLYDVVLMNSGNWFMPIFFSDRVTVSNLKILGYRANSDGIDIYSSRDVSVEGCFIRTVDDVITVKSKTQKPNVVAPTDMVSNVNVTGNRLWNETGTAMVIGTAVGTDISGVTFSNNDVIHDLARGASEGINLAGAGTVSNIRFENNRIDRSSNQIDAGGASRVIYVYIQHSQWEATADKNKPLGKVRDITFSNTTVLLPPQSPKMRIDLQGASDQSDIEGVQFQNITVNGKPLSKSNTLVNEKFASKVSGLP
jgi:hypothetical protein